MLFAEECDSESSREISQLHQIGEKLKSQRYDTYSYALVGEICHKKYNHKRSKTVLRKRHVQENSCQNNSV